MTKSTFAHNSIETKWQNAWKRVKLDFTPLEAAKKPFYNLMMFPYPSAEGLHVGNMYAFTGSDIYGRFKRMQGYEVFEPIGLDGFGIHSENYALKIGRHPMDHAKVTEEHFYDQLHKIGAMFDWDRTVETYDTDYYRWTQWLFVQMFKHGLAYRGRAQVNFCPSCKTVLADEQVIDGKCERCGNIVEKRLLEQWFFRITAYAEKLLENSFSLDWSEKVKVAQKNWIGKSAGINFYHKVKDLNITFEVYDSVPQTFLAQTFVVIAPEHPLVEKLVKGTKYEKPVMEFVENIKRKKLNKSFNIEKETEGIFTGRYSENYMGTGRDLPIWVASFVVLDYGTGIVGCSAHDERDFAFAKRYNLPLKAVMVPEDKKEAEKVRTFEICYHHAPEGIIQEPKILKGVTWADAREPIIKYIEQKGFGKTVINYHLRDWLISRQRYWGPPIPMIYCEKCAKEGKSWFTTDEAAAFGMSFAAHSSKQMLTMLEKTRLTAASNSAGWYPVPESDLPVVLPHIEDYRPGNDGIAPLAKHKEFYHVQCPSCGAQARRETDVSDTFLDSSWYFLRYPSVHNVIPASEPESSVQAKWIPGQARDDKKEQFPWDPAITKKWLPVHMYTGGAEHSVLHLMYSRFVTMALKDWGYIDFAEPFTRFYAHGLVIKDGAKMSKSKGNIVNPDQYIALYGADALRLYLMFMGPFDQGGDFRDSAMEGMSRWLGRVWRIGTTKFADQSSNEVKNALQKLIQKIGDDVEKRRYNTAIASMMEFTNLVADHEGKIAQKDFEALLLILAPFAPHTTEELWQLTHGKSAKDFTAASSIHRQSWPKYNLAGITEASVTIVVQVNGKMRDAVQIQSAKSKVQSEVQDAAYASERIKSHVEGKKVKKVIFIPGKLINFVV